MEERSFYLFNFIPFNRLDFFVYMINFSAVIFFPLGFMYYTMFCHCVFLFLFIKSRSHFKKDDLKSFLLQN